jgi:VWFA-related protein
MSARASVLAILVVASVLDGVLDNPARAFAQTPRAAYRAGVDLIALSVTVSSVGRQYVSDLNREEFSVLENGVPQTLTFFSRSSVPLGVALVLDTSASMEQALPIAQEAAIAFARTLRPADLASVVDFDSTVRTAQPFTNNITALEQAITQTTAGGSTALYNALYISLKEFGKLAPEDDTRAARRRAIVVLSDGDDTSSLVGFDEVLDAASRSDTVIYTIGLGRREANGRIPGQEGEFVLRRLAEQTGGRAFFPNEVKELAAVYADIREELSSQYSLAYESTGARDGQWRRIAVRVDRPNVIVRARQGYFAPAK